MWLGYGFEWQRGKEIGNQDSTIKWKMEDVVGRGWQIENKDRYDDIYEDVEDVYDRVIVRFQWRKVLNNNNNSWSV